MRFSIRQKNPPAVSEFDVIEADNLLVTIVTYNAAKLTIETLESVEPEIAAIPGSGAVLVDNGSTDGSIEVIRDAIEARGWGSWITFLQASDNAGFAAGNNVGLREAFSSPNPPRYFLLLNPDTIVRPGAIRKIYDFMEKNPKAGFAGGQCEYEDGTDQFSGFHFPNIIGDFLGRIRIGFLDKLFKHKLIRCETEDEPHQVEWVNGAAMMFRREVFESIGLLDQSYFLYFEETDLAYRAVKAGYEAWVVPSARIVHLVGHITQITQRAERARRRPDYWFDSRRRYFLANRGKLYMVGMDLASLAGQAIWNIRCMIQRKVNIDPPHFLRDQFRHSFLFRGFKIKERATGLDGPRAVTNSTKSKQDSTSS